MYVMLGAWIECKNAWTDLPDHNLENFEKNKNEVRAAIRLATSYPEIVKVIAIGNESMVHWATSYFVHPEVVLRWVNLVQSIKSFFNVTPLSIFSCCKGRRESCHHDAVNCNWLAPISK